MNEKVKEAKYRLLFYGMKYEWVRRKIKHIDFGMREICSEKEIEDYIKLIDLQCLNKTVEILDEKLAQTKDLTEKAELLNQIINLKLIMNGDK